MSASAFKQLIEAAVERFCRENPAQPAGLYDPVNYTLSLGGKRMRPLLVLMGCDLFGGKVEEALPAALAAELFHNFTLVHDDIMDNAALRRGKDSVHKKWGANTAILSGDVMLVAAYQELSTCGPEKLPFLLPVFNRMAAQVCEGQQLDMDFEKVASVTIEQYLKMIELKTAVLLGACLAMGAVMGGAGEKEVQQLNTFGKCLGVAFQLQDDALDVFGDQGKVGKKKGGDILANKKTYPLIRAMELSSPAQKKELQKWLHDTGADPDQKIGAVCSLYEELRIHELTKKAFTEHFQTAISQLNKVKADPVKKEALGQMAIDLLNREK